MTIGEDGESFKITKPTCPRYFWNNTDKFQDRINGSEAQKKAHGVVGNKIAGDKRKQVKTLTFRFPTDRAPALCPAETPLPLTINNSYFNEGKTNDYEVIPYLQRFGQKWTKEKQERKHMIVFVAFYVAIDGTVRAHSREKAASVDPLAKLFDGTLEFSDDDEEEEAKADGDHEEMES
jgi:hypothetical protein